MARLSHALTGGLPWLPVDACTLATAERPVRVAEFDRLFREQLDAIRTPRPTRAELILRDRPGLVAEIEDLVARETQCCSFFRFTVEATGGRLELVVEVPPDRSDVLAGLARRARAAVASGRA